MLRHFRAYSDVEVGSIHLFFFIKIIQREKKDFCCVNTLSEERAVDQNIRKMKVSKF